MTRVVVCGLAGSMPMGGMGLHYLQYCLAFRSLGVEVLYLEDTGAWPYDPVAGGYSEDGSYSSAWLHRMFSAFDLPWAYQSPDGAYHGASESEVHGWCRSADLLLNVSGAIRPRQHHQKARLLAFVDTDPAFLQVAVATGDVPVREWLAEHDVFFTFAESVGTASCRMPTDGRSWRGTRQPLHLPFWDEVLEPPGSTYTTVMQWKSYAPTSWQGEEWGQKDAEFHRVLGLPGRVDVPLELTVGGSAVPRDSLTSAGWLLRSPSGPSADIWSYREYLASSRGEVSVAKQAYVRSRSGWFSERSACYLAAGRPVIAQDTGWSEHLPSGKGLFAFDDEDSAVAAVETVESDLEAHGEAARRIATEHFDGRVVLSRLLSDAGVS